MYDIRQFRPVLYALLLLGFCGYAVAAETPGLWLLAVTGTLLNGYLVRHDAFRPLPRVVANVVTLLFAGWMILRVRLMPGSTIFAIGEFLTFLQLVKLYEQRGNRDIAQILVLSLLLMVAAAISTASLLFGLMFVAYLFLSLYCCLLFHLKTESDHARNVTGLSEAKLNPQTLGQDRRFLTRSMRRLTAVVSGSAIVVGVLVFVLFPRSIGAGVIGNLSFRPDQTMTGFNDTVNFQDVARITQNEAEVAYVAVRKGGQVWGQSGQTIYLRGSAPDTYVSDPDDQDCWKWQRSTATQSETPPDQPPGNGDNFYRQDVRLLPTGTHTLFAMPGVVSFKAARDVRTTRGASDDVLTAYDLGTSEINYTVYSTNADAVPARNAAAASPDLPQPPRHYPVPAAVRAYALRDDVAGVDAGGNLARQRLELGRVTDLDATLAENFETHLRTNFTYTLDLTDARRVAHEDPLVQFLYDFKKGHCEYFAGSMALLCQSVGMKARVVVGFKCDEFNSLGGYYIVRQSHAHAWTEVLTPQGWHRYDPTTSNLDAVTARSESLWQRMRYAMNFLEYKWGSSVVNYDAESAQNVISNASNGLQTTADTTAEWLQTFRLWLNKSTNFFTVFSGLLSGLVTVMFVAVAGVVVYFLFDRLRLRRRAARIGLASLPSEAQRRLAKQLGFYDDLLLALERRSVVRATHLTPREFGASVGFLPADVFDAVQRLTRIFYRVRYGQTVLQPAQQRRLVRSVERIDASLAAEGERAKA